jgi:hypothetical protein
MKQKVFVMAAVAALLAAGSLAAVSATGQSNHSKPAAGRKAARLHQARDLATASSYLGISSAQLTSELSSGKTLAQVAQATPGKSADGLIQALLAAKRAKVDALAAGLPRRVSAEVNRPGGPGRRALLASRRAGHGAHRIAALFAKPIRPGSVAAGYLGVSPSQLQSELRAGKTLGQVADATAGKSQAGLVAALVDAGRQRVDRAVSAGWLTAAHASKRLGHFEKRANALVKRQFAGGSSH